MLVGSHCSRRSPPRGIRVALVTLIPMVLQANQGNSQVSPAKARLVIGPPQLTIGPPGGAEQSAPHWLSAAVAMAGGQRIVVLDGERSVLRSFDANGTLQYDIGKPGRGPLGLGVPVSVVGFGNTVAVYDAGARRIREFAVHSHSASLKRDVTIPLHGTAMCRAGDAFVVNGLSKGALFHIVHDDGSVERSFGKTLSLRADDPPLVRESLAGVRMACVKDDRDMVVMGSPILGVVRAYSLNGDVIWETRLPTFRQMRIRATAKQVEFDGGPAHDELKALTSIGHGILAIQSYRWPALNTDGPANRRPEVQTYVLQSKSGEVLGVQTDIPLIADAGASTVYVVSQRTAAQLQRARLTIERR
jgi:hypothetical protein